MSHNIPGTEWTTRQVTANEKKPDFFSLAPAALAKDYCSLFVGSKRTHEALSKRVT